MASKPKPTMAENAAVRLCPNCGAEMPQRSGRGKPPVFCSADCRLEQKRRDEARGRVIVHLAQTWRSNRGSGETAKAAFAELCSAIDHFNNQDRKAGRPAADVRTAKLLNGGYRYIDRKRS